MGSHEALGPISSATSDSLLTGGSVGKCCRCLGNSMLCFVHKSASSRSEIARKISWFGTFARKSKSIISALARLVDELSGELLATGDGAKRRLGRANGVGEAEEVCHDSICLGEDGPPSPGCISVGEAPEPQF